jgi:hypothetical protein
LVYVFFNVGTPEQPEIIQRQRKYVRPVFWRWARQANTTS